MWCELKVLGVGVLQPFYSHLSYGSILYRLHIETCAFSAAGIISWNSQSSTACDSTGIPQSSSLHPFNRIFILRPLTALERKFLLVFFFAVLFGGLATQSVVFLEVI
jgi:hypothetical protein